MTNNDIRQRQKVLNTPNVGKVIADLLLLLNEEMGDDVNEITHEELGKQTKKYMQMLRARYKNALRVDSIIVRQMDIEQVIEQMRKDGK